MHLGGNGEGMVYMEILFDLPNTFNAQVFYNVDRSHNLLMFK